VRVLYDYHLHLWPHESTETPLEIGQLAAYCEQAAAAGVTEIALTEHLFRFRQAMEVIGPFWEAVDDEPSMRSSMAGYVAHHATADLDAYVELGLEAKRLGLPVKIGLEVDYYRGQMGDVADLLAAYPFDVLLGSVHWVGAWRFDHLEDGLQLARWDSRDVEACWDAYTEAIEELAATRAIDVLAHPDLIKVAGRIPSNPVEWWDRIAEASKDAGVATELSSAGWRKPVGEQYPAIPLLDRLLAAEVPMTTASDAHHQATVGDGIGDLVALATIAGLRSIARFDARVRSEVLL